MQECTGVLELCSRRERSRNERCRAGVKELERPEAEECLFSFC